MYSISRVTTHHDDPLGTTRIVDVTPVPRRVVTYPRTDRPSTSAPHAHIMSLTVSVSTAVASRVSRVSRASSRVPRGAVALVRRATESDADASSSVADAVSEANAAWKDVADETSSVAAAAALIDPADGSVAEAAPLGDDNSLLERAMVAFTDSRAVEIINGRAAMIGWMLALSAELNRSQSLWGQLFNTRTFTLADGVSRTSTYPAAGFFLVPLVVLVALGASLAPTLKKSSPNGLNETPEAFGPFKPEAELTNGRGAMVGLSSLLLVENFTNGALF